MEAVMGANKNFFLLNFSLFFMRYLTLSKFQYQPTLLSADIEQNVR
jgi:hypothetical protein